MPAHRCRRCHRESRPRWGWSRTGRPRVGSTARREPEPRLPATLRMPDCPTVPGPPERPGGPRSPSPSGAGGRRGRNGADHDRRALPRAGRSAANPDTSEDRLGPGGATRLRWSGPSLHRRPNPTGAATPHPMGCLLTGPSLARRRAHVDPGPNRHGSMPANPADQCLPAGRRRTGHHATGRSPNGAATRPRPLRPHQPQPRCGESRHRRTPTDPSPHGRRRTPTDPSPHGRRRTRTDPSPHGRRRIPNGPIPPDRPPAWREPKPAPDRLAPPPAPRPAPDRAEGARLPERSGPSRRPPSRPAYGAIPTPTRTTIPPATVTTGIRRSRPRLPTPNDHPAGHRHDRHTAIPTPTPTPNDHPAGHRHDRRTGTAIPTDHPGGADPKRRSRSSSCLGRRLVGPGVPGPRPGGRRCPGRPPVARPGEGGESAEVHPVGSRTAGSGRPAGRSLNRLLLEPAAASARRRHQEEGESYGRCYRLARRCLPLAPGAPTPPTPGNGVGGVGYEYSGDVLLSQGASPQVPSALAGLTSVFGMGTGVTPPLWPPETLLKRRLGAAERRRPAPVSVP